VSEFLKFCNEEVGPFLVQERFVLYEAYTKGQYKARSLYNSRGFKILEKYKTESFSKPVHTPIMYRDLFLKLKAKDILALDIQDSASVLGALSISDKIDNFVCSTQYDDRAGAAINLINRFDEDDKFKLYQTKAERLQLGHNAFDVIVFNADNFKEDGRSRKDWYEEKILGTLVKLLVSLKHNGRLLIISEDVTITNKIQDFINLSLGLVYLYCVGSENELGLHHPIWVYKKRSK
jgi:hypothetical protein